MKITKRSLAFFALGLFLIADRFLKSLAESISPKETELIPKIADFGFYPNPLLFFILDLPPLLTFGIVLSALILLFIFFSGQKAKDSLPFYFLFGGALSNFYDRAFKGAVIDFLSFFDLTTVNLADLLILVGLAKIFFSLRK